MAEQQSAVAVTSEFRPREVISLGKYPRDKFNVLIPGSFTFQMSPFLVPVAREVTLDPDPEHGEVYVQEWTKRDGQFVAKALGINALGLGILGDVQGILDVPQASGRVDDGRDPGVCTYRSTMFMRLPDGQPIVRTRECTLELAQLYEEIELRITKKGAENKWNGKAEPWPAKRVAEEIKKEQLLARKFFHRKCETGAKARTYRALMNIRGKYSPAEIARPFVVAAVVQDYSQPEVAARMLDQATSVSGLGWPGGTGGGDVGAPPRQLAAGPTGDQVEAALAEAPPAERMTAEEIGGVVVDDDQEDVAADAYAAAGSKPGWARGAPDAAAAKKGLLELLGDSAAASEKTGPMTPEQDKALERLMAKLDWDEDIVPVLVGAFSDAAARSLTEGQAGAIIAVSNSFDSNAEFVAAWKAAAGQAAT